MVFQKQGVPQLVLRAMPKRIAGVTDTQLSSPTLWQINSAERIFTDVGRDLSKNVQVSGIQNIPSDGPALIVCNHPTGIADGLILHHALLARRDDIYFFANRDITRVFPQMESMIAPVEWRPEKRKHTNMRLSYAVCS